MSNQSADQKAKIKAAFEKLEKGDVVIGDGFSLVVIRHIDESAVIGIICQKCGERHEADVLNDTYLWSDELGAIVDSTGKVAEWWSPDLMAVEKGAATDIAEMSMGIPIDADYYVYTKQSRSDLLDAYKDRLLSCIPVLQYGGSRTASLRRALEIVGMPMNDEQALILSAITAANERIHSSSSGSSMLAILISSLGQEH